VRDLRRRLEQLQRRTAADVDDCTCPIQILNMDQQPAPCHRVGGYPYDRPGGCPSGRPRAIRFIEIAHTGGESGGEMSP
jgi:hypothetical protein